MDKTLALMLAVVLAACNGGGNGTEEDAVDDGDVVEETTVDVIEVPTLDVVEEADAADDPIEEPGRDCAGTYPSGPFGWKGAIRENTTGIYWDGNGDYLENIYLMNHEDVPTLPAQVYCSNDIDVLFYDFTAMWCPPCNQAADEENDFIEWMSLHGWNVAFMSVLEEDTEGNRATREHAETWRTSHGIHSDVMYDPMWLYHTAPFRDYWPEEEGRGWPTFMVVNPDNMLIWYAFSGWRGSYPMVDFFSGLLEVFEMGAANDPEYIH